MEAATSDDAEPTRTDPRVDRTRAAVLSAAREILVNEGWDAVTQLRVAEASGVARATMYRHWPDRSMILYDVLAAEELAMQFEPTGDLRSDLVEHLDRFRRALTDASMGRVLTALVDRAEWEAPLMEVKVRLADQQVAFLRQLVVEGRDAGVVRADVDLDLVVAQLFGPILYRRLFSGEELADGFTEVLVDTTLTQICV